MVDERTHNRAGYSDPARRNDLHPVHRSRSSSSAIFGAQLGAALFPVDHRQIEPEPRGFEGRAPISSGPRRSKTVPTLAPCSRSSVIR
jgi:hypothetical protein